MFCPLLGLFLSWQSRFGSRDMAIDLTRQDSKLIPTMVCGGRLDSLVGRSKLPISFAFRVAEFLRNSWVSSRTSFGSVLMKLATLSMVTNVSVWDSDTCVYWSDGARLRPAICNISSVWRFL